MLSRPDAVPRVLVDSTTISQAASDDVRAVAAERGTGVLAAPVSGNAKVVAAGRLTMVVSGPEPAYREASDLLELLAAKVTYVGEGDRARLVKICHNLMLGVVAQTLAEITVLAEKGGVSRADFFAFLNDSVMGSMFTRYKTPAYVNLDFKPTFTPQLLLKDFRLGADAAREHEIPMPVSAAAEQVVQALVGRGDEDIDFAVLLELQAQLSGLELVSEDAPVTDGLRDEVRVAVSRWRSPRSARPSSTPLERYGRMLLIRQFENEIHRLFLKGEVHGTTHLYAGQEAVAVGVTWALGAGDWIAGTYRGHGHCLAAGTEPEALVAEMLGRATGVCGGRSGSMNVDRPRARDGRLLRDRRRVDRRRHRRRAVGEADRQRRGRVLRRRRDQPAATSTSA